MITYLTLAVLTMLLLACLGLLVVSDKRQAKLTLQAMAALSEANQSLSTTHQTLLMNSLNLLSTKDPIAFQQIVASQSNSLSNSHYVPMDDEAEFERVEELLGVELEDLDEFDRQQLNGL